MEQREGYKKTKIGWIPDDWRVVKLMDIADTADRYSIAGGPFGSDLKSEHYTELGVRIIQLQNMGDGSFLNDYHIYTSEEKADELKKCNVYPGEIIIAKMAEPLARACKIPNSDNRYLMCSDGIRLKVNLSKFNNNYVLYTINSKYFRKIAEANGTGTTRLRIGLKTLKSLPILSPPLPEQNKIASILTTVDDKISSIENQIQQTEQLKKGLMEKLLTEGIGHTEFKDTKIGRIPRSWDCLSLDNAKIDIVDGDRGVNYPKQDNFLENGFCLFLTAKNVSKIGFKFIETQYISEKRDNLLRKGKLKRDDIVITTRGTVGNIAWYNDEIEFKNIRINSGMALIRKTQMNFDSLFLYLVLRSHLAQKQIKLIAFGSAQPQLTIKEIKKFQVILPPFQEQKQIASILSTVDDKIEILTQKKVQYQTLKKGLMQQLLTGQMRVKV